MNYVEYDFSAMTHRMSVI